MKTILYWLLQVAAALLLAPLPIGAIRKVKALVQKRKGAPLLQLYRDLLKLLRKSAVVSDATSWVLRAAPFVVFATSLFAAAMMPATVRSSTASSITSA